jgi:long-chain acyl-CoA synthetase
MSTDTKQGPAAMTPASVAAMFFGRVRKSADREAFRKLDGDRWVSVTWQEAAEQVE